MEKNILWYKEILSNNGINYYKLKIFSKKPLHIHFKCAKCNVMIDVDDTDIILQYMQGRTECQDQPNLEE